MLLTTDDLIRIAGWEPAVAGFDRDEATVEKYIQPILDQIGVPENALGSVFEKVAYNIFETGGLSNYFAFFVFCPQDRGREHAVYRFQAGITVYLSLFAPVGVIGKAERMLGQGVEAPPYLEIEDLIDPCDCASPLAVLTAKAISTAEYRLLSPNEARQPLPPGVQPYEYCMCHEPWDRVFHGLFANTD